MRFPEVQFHSYDSDDDDDEEFLSSFCAST